MPNATLQPSAVAKYEQDVQDWYESRMAQITAESEYHRKRNIELNAERLALDTAWMAEDYTAYHAARKGEYPYK